MKRVRLVSRDGQGTPGLVVTEDGEEVWMVLARRPMWKLSPERLPDGRTTIAPLTGGDGAVGDATDRFVHVIFLRGDKPNMVRGESVEELTFEDLGTPDTFPSVLRIGPTVDPTKVSSMRSWLESAGGVGSLFRSCCYGPLTSLPQKRGRMGVPTARIRPIIPLTSNPSPSDGDRPRVRGADSMAITARNTYDLVRRVDRGVVHADSIHNPAYPGTSPWHDEVKLRGFVASSGSREALRGRTRVQTMTVGLVATLRNNPATRLGVRISRPPGGVPLSFKMGVVDQEAVDLVEVMVEGSGRGERPSVQRVTVNPVSGPDGQAFTDVHGVFAGGEATSILECVTRKPSSRFLRGDRGDVAGVQLNTYYATVEAVTDDAARGLRVNVGPTSSTLFC